MRHTYPRTYLKYNMHVSLELFLGVVDLELQKEGSKFNGSGMENNVIRYNLCVFFFRCSDKSVKW